MVVRRVEWVRPLTCHGAGADAKHRARRMREGRLATAFFGCFDANDLSGALAMMADGATWWIAGKPSQSSVGENQYHMLLTIRDGKLQAVREYCDTYHVFATWLEP